MKVTIRKKPLSKNRNRLILDYYPALTNPLNGKKTRYENLRLFVYEVPSNQTEFTHNSETFKLAESICAKRQLDIQVQLHGFTPNHKKEQSFNAYFRRLADRKRGLNWHNWNSGVRYFELFVDRDIRFLDLDLNLCEDFKAFLLTEPKLRDARRGIGHNSALSYFNKFRAALKQAWREKLIDDDLHAICPGLKEMEAHVEFLTMEDIKLLLATPVTQDKCKRVVLLGIITGLRFCDVQNLRWRDVSGTKNNYYLHFRQLKTYKTQHVPISNQAFDLLGDRQQPDEKVFNKIYYNQIRDFLVKWPSDAGINKHITFSCLRHTYATLQLDHGTDIYTISKMLGHRHLKTTQRYTRVMDKSKKEAAERLVLDL